MTRRFTLAHGHAGQRYWLDVAVYDTVDAMRRAALRHDPDSADDALAIFQSKDRPAPTSRHLGVLRLNVEHLDAGIIVHEAVHAAVAYVTRLNRETHFALNAHSPAGSVMGEREETLAYAVQGMSAALLQALALVTA